MLDTNLIHEAASVIRGSKHPCILTGAGVSKESGVPTFRDTDGLWSNHDMRKLASVAGFHENPQGVWAFFEMCRATVQEAQPNPGHYALAQLERDHFPELPVITQNMDDLHERAGSSNVIHMHGLISQNRCSRYCKGVPSVVDNSAIDWSDVERPPRCPYCHAYVRPNVTLFGEFLHSAPMRRAEDAIHQGDLMIVIGTSGVVAPVSEMPQMAKDNGAVLIEINPQPSQITPLADLWIPAPSGEVLPKLMDELAKMNA